MKAPFPCCGNEQTYRISPVITEVNIIFLENSPYFNPSQVKSQGNRNRIDRDRWVNLRLINQSKLSPLFRLYSAAYPIEGTNRRGGGGPWNFESIPRTGNWDAWWWCPLIQMESVGMVDRRGGQTLLQCSWRVNGTLEDPPRGRSITRDWRSRLIRRRGSLVAIQESSLWKMRRRRGDEETRMFCEVLVSWDWMLMKIDDNRWCWANRESFSI